MEIKMKRSMESYGDAFLFLLLLLLLLLFVHNAVTANSNQQYPTQNNDMQTMSALSNLVPAFYWPGAKGSSDPCTWKGVYCADQVITILSLAGSRLPANITDSTTSSWSLLFFDLLCQLNSLQFLDLSYNHFTYIPTSFLSNCSGLSQLRSLNLSSNRLAGTLGNFSSFPALETLDLSYNMLTGISTHLLSPPALSYVDLSYNLLQGTIPANISSGLYNLFLQYNNLSGEIPKELLKLENLLRLDLSHNSLTGAIPSEISGLKTLTNLNLEGNMLDGSIPDTISALGYLIELRLGNNKLNGKVPGMPKSLSFSLNLSGNLLTGPIPSYLGDLQILDLSNNEFTGEVPSSLTLMQSLTLLDLSNNLLSGIPPQFQPWTHVTLTGNKDIVLDARPLHRFAILVMVASFVGGFFVSIVLARIFQEVILRCFYNGKDETSAASRRAIHEPEPQLVELENLRRIRRQLDVAAAKYR